jgi:hypothetical protein
MRRIGQFAIGAAAALLSSSAWAQSQSFGQQGQVAISAERLFGFVHTIQSANNATNSFDSISLFASPLNGLATPYSTPRVAFDYFAAPGFSLGAALGFQHLGSSSHAGATADVVVFAPRVGYAAVINESVGIWPRLGMTYESLSLGSETLHAYALTLEAPIVITPMPHAALTIGPTLDLGLAGSETESDGARIGDIKETGIGVQAGLLIYL